VLTAWHKVCPVSDTVSLTVLDTPRINLDDGKLVCKGLAEQVQVQGDAGYRYQWSPVQGVSDPSIASPMIAANADGYYRVVATTADNCTSEDSIYIRVRSPDEFSIKAYPASLCPGDSSVLRLSGADASLGDSYTWISAIGNQDASSPQIVVSPSSSTVYQAQAWDNTCQQQRTLTASVEVKDVPGVALSKSNDINCIYGEAQLTASAPDGFRYSWYPAQTLDNPYRADPIARTDTDTRYYVVVTGRNGCSTLDSIPLYATKAGGTIGFPVANAFTPNGDGNNDCFGIKYWGFVGDFEMEVFDRWGMKVYYSKDPSQCWDGRRNGVPQPAGAYVYYIKAHALCGDAIRKGTVMLIR
jgi:gliding motility-associated-like protein